MLLCKVGRGRSCVARTRGERLELAPAAARELDHQDGEALSSRELARVSHVSWVRGNKRARVRHDYYTLEAVRSGLGDRSSQERPCGEDELEFSVYPTALRASRSPPARLDQRILTLGERLRMPGVKSGQHSVVRLCSGNSAERARRLSCPPVCGV